MTIINPIIPGFNADPACLAVGSDYYIVTSTFEWFPGISVYHSQDLATWRFVGNALTRQSQLDLRGFGDSCGIWAPDITFHNGRFYLCYTLMKQLSASFFDLDNYLVTSESIEGPWSDPIYLNSSGFDPALLHDNDGRKWVCNLRWESRQGYPHPGEIVLQEFDAEAGSLINEPVAIYSGDRHFGCLEGPRIYHIGQWYYLMTAEGGTGYGHAALVSRSKRIDGPYESSPHNPLLTSRANPRPQALDFSTDYLKPRFFNPETALQKAGHAAMMQAADGSWYLTHLCARPVRPFQRCMLGRETSIQRLKWLHSWPILDAYDAPRPAAEVEIGPRSKTAASLPDGNRLTMSVPATPVGRTEFSSTLPPYLHSLRSPIDESWLSLTRRPGCISIRGRDSVYSRHEQSLLARRIQHFAFRAEAELIFTPKHIQEMAGLICLFSVRTFAYLRLYRSASLGGPCLGILLSRNEQPEELLEHRIVLDRFNGSIRLAVEVDTPELRLLYAAAGDQWHRIGPAIDSTILADEFSDNGAGAFSGSFVGICAQDLRDKSSWAEFSYLEYEALEE